jgi:hypothetical protein
MRRTVLALTFALYSADVTSAQQRPLPFDTGWTLDREGAAIVNVDGRQALAVESGYAHRRDVKMMDGTIDFDVQLTRRRSFVYVHFRVVSDDEREEFYLRPHKSQLPDAAQYAPVFQGVSAWQLHHGPGGTAAVGFDPGVWTHVRVVMQERRAALFVGDMSTPALLVPALAREPQAGGIALGGFLPANVPGEGPIARFANVVVSPDVSFDFTAALAKVAAAAKPGGPQSAAIVRTWSVSRAFVPKDAASPTLPAADVTGQFTPLQTEPDGRLNLHRHVKLPRSDSPAVAAVARFTVRAAHAGTYAMDLGFSDTATVFVNGTPLFYGNDSYSFDRPRRDGLIGFDQARLFLPLRAGDNEVAVVVSEIFGGWGIMARFLDARSLTLARELPTPNAQLLKPW